MHLSCKKILNLIPDFFQQQRQHGNELKIKEAQDQAALKIKKLEDKIHFRRTQADRYRKTVPNYANECDRIINKAMQEIVEVRNDSWRVSHAR